MAVTDAKPVARYGEPYLLYLPLFDETGSLNYLEGTLALISKDGGPMLETANTPVSVADSGIFSLLLTDDETTANAVAVLLVPASATHKVTPVILYPEKPGDIRVQTVSIELSATQELIEELLAESVSGSYDSNSVAGVLAGLMGRTPTVTVFTPVLEGGNLSIVRGDDYLSEDGRAITWTSVSGAWPDLDGTQVYFVVSDPRFFRKEVTVVDGTGTPKVLSIDLTRVETRKFTSPSYPFIVEAISPSGSRMTLLKGSLKTTGGL